MKLAGKVAIVTGSARIGKAMATRFASEGASVVIAVIDKEEERPRLSR